MSLFHKWVFKSSYYFFGEWVPILDLEKSLWKVTFASGSWSCVTFSACGFLYWTLTKASGKTHLQLGLQIFIPFFLHMGSHTESWKKLAGSHIRKWCIKPSCHFFGLWVPILDPKKSQREVVFTSDTMTSSSTCTKQDHITSKWGLTMAQKSQKPHKASKRHEKATKNAHTYCQGKEDTKMTKQG